MALIPVKLAKQEYNVLVGHNLLENIRDHAARFLNKKSAYVVADKNARSHHGESLEIGMAKAGVEINWFEVAAGESSKSWETLQKLTEWMLHEGVERGDYVFALGGGVIGDLTGFACAILKRGCHFIQLPTTLLAQVDSSVGGKTAINTAAGKNLIGAFHQPSFVLADLNTLYTLPDREMRSGYAEVIKYGLLGDESFFNWLNNNVGHITSLDHKLLEQAIATSVRTKTRIVSEDEYELTGRRALLNLGHTFGHALEAETGFSQTLLHGEAVALGMVLAARYSERLGLIDKGHSEKVTMVIDKFGLPSAISSIGLSCGGEKLVEHMLHDKKMKEGNLPFILLNKIGEAKVIHDVDLSDVTKFLNGELSS